MSARSLILLIAAAVLWAGCREGAAPGYVRLDGPAPELSGPRERALLVTFWATWCPPCVEETPELLRLAANPPEGLALVVVSEDRDLAAVERFFEGRPDPRLNLRLDPGEKVAGAFGASELPVSFLVRDGRLVARFDGPRKWDDRPMRRLLERLLAEAQPAAPRPEH